MPAVEVEIDPKDRMDSFRLGRVKEREETFRAIATLRENDSNMCLPEDVEIFDEDEEKKRGKKRRTRQEPPADDLANTLTDEYKSKPSLLTISEEELITKHEESFLGVQKGMEAVLRHRIQNGEPYRTTSTPGEAATMRKPVEANDGDVYMGKVGADNREEGYDGKPATNDKYTPAARFFDRAGNRTAAALATLSPIVTPPMTTGASIESSTTSVRRSCRRSSAQYASAIRTSAFSVC